MVLVNYKPRRGNREENDSTDWGNNNKVQDIHFINYLDITPNKPWYMSQCTENNISCIPLTTSLSN